MEKILQAKLRMVQKDLSFSDFTESSIILTSKELDFLNKNSYVLRPVKLYKGYGMLSLIMILKIDDESIPGMSLKTMCDKFCRENEKQIMETIIDIICDGGFDGKD
jgi:hypothetical protein